MSSRFSMHDSAIQPKRRLSWLLALAAVASVWVVPAGLLAADYDADKEAAVILAQLVDQPSADEAEHSTGDTLATPAMLPTPEETIEAPTLDVSSVEDILEREEAIPLCTTGETYDGELWYSDIEFVYYFRQPLRQNFTIAIDTAATSLNDLTTRNLGLKWRPGIRATLGRSLGPDNNDRDQSLEFTYGGLFEWFRGTSLSGPGGAASIENQFLSGFLPANTVRGEYHAHLNSYEFNFRRQERLEQDRLIMAPDGTWSRQCTPGFIKSTFGGIRYIRYDEDFRLFSTRTVTGTGYDASQTYDTTNDMFGVQAGVELIHQDCRWYWGIRGKAAAMINVAHLNRHDLAVFEGGGTAEFTQTGAGDRLATMVEMGMFGVYQFHPKVGLRVAYEAMWLNGIAIAPDAVQDFGFGLDSDITANENGIFHGLFLGLDMRW